MNWKISILFALCTSFFRNVNLFFAFAAFALGLCQATTADAFPGDLDQTFGRNGTAQVPFGNFDNLRTAAIQPDGKIIAVGANQDGSSLKILIIRLNSDGSLDASFDNDGIVLTPLNGQLAMATAVRLQTDGKIVVSGTVGLNAESEFAVVRYNSDGSLDSGFGTDGIVITHVGDSYDDAAAIGLQPDGKIIVAGRTSLAAFITSYALVRYNPNGLLDAAFGNGGIIKTSIGNFGGAEAVAIQADGKIIAAGYGQAGVPNPDFAVARYNSDGTLDRTFDGDGIATTSFGNDLDERINAVALQPDGKIVALGTARNDNGTFAAALARYNTDGSLDSNFGEGGKLTFTFGVGSTAAFALALQPDGKIIGGGHSNPTSSYHSTIFRLNGNGTFDWSFGNRGVVFNSLNNSLVGLLVQTDGKIIGVNSREIKRFVTGGGAYFDFDADRKDDISVFRPSTSSWYFINSAANTFQVAQFGVSTDSIVSADYDGDGKTDIAVFREGVWYWLNSSDNSFNAVQFGQISDIPVPADYTGDGRAEIAVYRSGVWWTLNLANNQFQALQFGISTDKPVPADYDGDGKTDYAVYRDGIWYSLRSSQGFSAIQFGVATDKPVVGDYDGDGKTDQAVYRSGVWYVLGSTQGFYAVQFGIASDVTVAADYDGDGRTDVAVFREGIWYWLNSSNNQFRAVQFGTTNDRPIPAMFVP